MLRRCALPHISWMDQQHHGGRITLFPIATVTWDQFQQAFCTAHVSTGAMNLKKREFRNSRQGNRTVAQYADEFSKLSRYAPDDVATDDAKQEKFMEGLNDVATEHAFDGGNIQQLPGVGR